MADIRSIYPFDVWHALVDVQKRQERRLKDIDRSFGVLQPRFSILRHKDRCWYKGIILDFSKAGVIIDNLLIRVSKVGHFSAELDEEHEEVDLGSALYDEQVERTAERA